MKILPKLLASAALAATLSLCAAHAADAPAATLEMRLVVDCTPSAKMLSHDNQGTPENLCLSPDLILDRSDITGAEAVHTAYGTDAIRLTVDPKAVERLTAATAKAAGMRGRIGVVYNGKLVAAPMVMEPITGNQLEIDVGSTGDSVEDLIADLGTRPAP